MKDVCLQLSGMLAVSCRSQQLVHPQFRAYKTWNWTHPYVLAGMQLSAANLHVLQRCRLMRTTKARMAGILPTPQPIIWQPPCAGTFPQ
jgi:hypothetical protein